MKLQTGFIYHDRTRIFMEETIMKTEVNVEKLIKTFKDMAERESLLARGNVTQQDLLIQIIGTITYVAMEDEKSE